ncbi:MAG: hypothetical protein J6D12_07965 [Peptostreptococcaceae bacterium]|nr:hypothetical protein [Peptostreptococcaceae bacterium]
MKRIQLGKEYRYCENGDYYIVTFVQNNFCPEYPYLMVDMDTKEVMEQFATKESAAEALIETKFIVAQDIIINRNRGNKIRPQLYLRSEEDRVDYHMLVNDIECTYMWNLTKDEMDEIMQICKIFDVDLEIIEL